MIFFSMFDIVNLLLKRTMGEDAEKPHFTFVILSALVVRG